MVGKYRIGQSVGVVPTGRFNDAEFNYAHEALNDKIRLYSITSACWGDDWKGETVSLCVKREIAEDAETGELVLGVDSNYICDAKPGDEMLITGPVGKSFLLPDNPLDYNYVFTATGTGIAPFVGMLVELFNQGFEREVWLVFGVPYSTDIMYHEEFLYFAERSSEFSLYHCDQPGTDQRSRRQDVCAGPPRRKSGRAHPPDRAAGYPILYVWSKRHGIRYLSVALSDRVEPCQPTGRFDCGGH